MPVRTKKKSSLKSQFAAAIKKNDDVTKKILTI